MPGSLLRMNNSAIENAARVSVDPAAAPAIGVVRATPAATKAVVLFPMAPAGNSKRRRLLSLSTSKRLATGQLTAPKPSMAITAHWWSTNGSSPVHERRTGCPRIAEGVTT